jgi:hypothetical protein
MVPSQQIVLEILSQKYSTQKGAGRVAQVVDLPGKCEALSSNPIPAKKKPKASEWWS